MQFQVKHFSELTPAELHKIYALRAEVFVVEQDCPYLDPDEKDPAALHMSGYESNSLVAYCRIIPPGVSYQEASIGRVVVPAKERNKGMGRKLMSEAIHVTLNMFKAGEIVISAQCYLEPFYKSLGFVSESAPYEEDGIPHVRMRYQATAAR